MSQENVEMVRRVNDLFNAAEIEQALDLVDDDLEMDWTNSIGPLKGVYRGREGVVELWKSFLDAWESVRWDPEEVVEVDAKAAQLWTFRAGRAKRIKLYQSKAEALEAAGLRE